MARNSVPDEYQDAVVFRGAPAVNAGMAVFFFAILGLGVWVAFLPNHKSYGPLTQLVCILGALGIGWCALRSALNVCRGQRVILAVGRRGILDWRNSDMWIPWTALKNVDELTPIFGFRSG